MQDISKDRGAEEIPVLVDLEVQHWMAEALEGATRASELARDRIALISVRCPGRGREENWNEADGPSPTARRAAQAVMDAATGDPLSDSQLERVVRLVLRKRDPTMVETGEAVAAHAATTAGGGGSSQTLAAAADFIRSHQIKQRAEPEDEGESRPSEPVEAGESPPEVSGVQPAPPEQQQVTTQAPPEVSEAQSGGCESAHRDGDQSPKKEEEEQSGEEGC
jgi:hypothetical protein